MWIAPRAARPLPGFYVHRFVRDAGLGRKMPIDDRAVTDQETVAGQHRRQAFVQLRHRHLTPSRVKIQRLAIAVARDEQTIVFPTDTAPLCRAAALPRRPRQLARAFLRFEPVQRISVHITNANTAFFFANVNGNVVAT